MASGEVLRFHFLHHESATLKKMNQLRLEERFCDVTVLVDRLRFPGHRVVLAACSPFLRDQFLLNPAKEIRVSLADGGETASRLLLSCYTGALDFPFKDVVNYLTTASYLQMDHVVEECRRALSRYVDPRIKIKEDGGGGRSSPAAAAVRVGTRWPPAGCVAVSPEAQSQTLAKQEEPPELKSESEDNGGGDDDDVYVIIDADSPASSAGEASRSRRTTAVGGGAAARQSDQARVRARPQPGLPYGVSQATDEEEEEEDDEQEEEEVGFVLMGGSFPDEDSSASEECGPGYPAKAPDPRPDPCPQPIHCTECDQSFQHPEHLVAHMKAHKLFMCPRCGKVFSQRVNLARHIHVHTGIKPYLCTICGKTFTQNRSLKDHMNLHSGDRPHHCHYCNMSFAHKPALRRHLKEQHCKTTADNCKLAQISLVSEARLL
ncbi:zinc finger and BTB domain-containing protein 12-like [Heptranchias perlo]|uniref:zinc finger and BTB domain-containing protein 12-like n=1 Tax=Heptranchias perlo TaxID=212740 RepID=UPI00355A8365